MNKVLLIDKPAGWTSFDVVAKIRNEAGRITGDKKIRVGHAGTLDPFATGLLIVLVGKEVTKRQDEYMKQDKEYEATLKLGFTSTTGDPEGKITEITNYELPITKQNPNSHVIPVKTGIQEKGNGSLGLRPGMTSEGEIERILEKFTGEIEQTPPIYSAIKVDGKRAYARARNGEDFVMKSRKVTIHELEILNFKFPVLKLRVKCSSGTYIRTLAEDIGKALGCGAYLTSLRRTQIGGYRIEKAQNIEEAVQSLSLENTDSN